MALETASREAARQSKRSAQGGKVKIYVIRDLVAEESGPIFEAKNDEVARRGFKALMEKQKTASYEFKLLCLGEMDHDNDSLKAYPFPQELMTGEEPK